MQRFTELYYEDAEHLALYISKRDNEEIIMTQESGNAFPLPPKAKSMPKQVNALKVGEYMIAYLEKERNGEDLKYRDRNLYRVMMGDMLKTARIAKGMTLDELSEKTGIKARNIANIEAGRFDATVDVLCNLVNAMGMSIKFGTD